MQAVLCKNVPVVRDFRDVICPAAWKNPGSVCGHVAPFPVFPEIFFGFPAFRGRNFGRDFPAGRRKMVVGFIFFVFRLAQNWPFSGNSCPPVGKKWSFSRNFCPSAGKNWLFLGNFRLPVGKKWRFLENFCSLDDIKLTVPGGQIRKIRDFSEVRNGFFQAFFSVP